MLRGVEFAHACLCTSISHDMALPCRRSHKMQIHALTEPAFSQAAPSSCRWPTKGRSAWKCFTCVSRTCYELIHAVVQKDLMIYTGPALGPALYGMHSLHAYMSHARHESCLNMKGMDACHECSCSQNVHVHVKVACLPHLYATFKVAGFGVYNFQLHIKRGNFAFQVHGIRTSQQPFAHN